MSYTKCIQAFVMRNATVPIVNIPEEKRKRKKSDKKLDKNYLFQKWPTHGTELGPIYISQNLVE